MYLKILELRLQKQVEEHMSEEHDVLYTKKQIKAFGKWHMTGIYCLGTDTIYLGRGAEDFKIEGTLSHESIHVALDHLFPQTREVHHFFDRLTMKIDKQGKEEWR
jgi:hypothetical protein